MEDKKHTNIDNKSEKPSNEKTPEQALNDVYKKQPIEKKELELFKNEFQSFFNKIDEKENEEFHKNLIRDFLNDTKFPNFVDYKNTYYINTKDRTDLVIYNGKDTKSLPAVLIEVKRPGKTNEIVSKDNLNAKSFQELVLYYLIERVKNKNWELKHFIITNIYEWFFFDAVDFKKFF